MALLPEVNGHKRVMLYGGVEKNRQVIQAGSISETSSEFSFLRVCKLIVSISSEHPAIFLLADDRIPGRLGRGTGS